ncbi:MAG TPA: DUF2905 domain-containing protein [Opitutaceae bacterium]|nr:DUF2905 domain-containing protein [Opitutaceae bacterium]
MRDSLGRMETLGKNLVALGLLLALIGAALWILGRQGGGLLPGDIVVERKNFRFYFPVVTCLVVSAVLSLLAWLLRR